MTAQALSLVLFIALASMVLAWFVLIKQLYNRLERTHPEKYEAMGRPSLFLRNNIATNWALLKFLVGREHRVLGDYGLSKLSDAMLVFAAIYLVLLFGMVFWLTGQAAAV